MTYKGQIEAILFYKTEPVSFDFLSSILEIPLPEVHNAIMELDEELKDRGVRLLRTDREVQLVTAPTYAPLIEKIRTSELSSDIGKSGAETLAIIAYRGPLSRNEIESIRGVNSTFILRNLLIRGLVERRPHPKDTRSYLYASTPALFAHLGVTSREELPDFASVMNEIDAFEKIQTVEDNTPLA